MGLKQNQALLEQYPILEFFQYNHLEDGPLRRTSALFNTLAWKLVKTVPDSHELRKALDRLLESKEGAVRASMSLPTE